MSGVTVTGVSKYYGSTPALHEVDLEVRRGELFFLLGPSGCGKTTLLRVLAGFIEPDEGSVSFGGKAVDDLPPHLRQTGMVFQNYALWPHMTVAQNVAYGLKVRKLPSADIRRRVDKALQMVHMADVAGRSPNQLSGGQQQRVALARALVIEPEIILLDEPLSNLDAKLRLEMRSEIRRIHDETGITTIYVTHDQKEALSMADRIAVMDRGRIVQVGAPGEVYEDPFNRFVAEFVGETNFFPATVIEKNTGGAVVLDSPLGKVSIPESRMKGTATEKVLCSLRPEAITIEQNETAAGSGLCRFEGTVSSVTYLGDMIQVVLRLDAGTAISVHAIHPRRLKAAPGERLACTFHCDDLTVFAS